jgi:hypothetical protein
VKHVQHRALTIPALLLAWASASCSSEMRLSDIAIEGTSEQEGCEYLYFKPSEGLRCAGVRIRAEGTRRRISFHEAGNARVDSKARLATEYPWAGNLRVEIPIDPKILDDGGEMTLVLEGRGKSIELGTMIYPAASRAGR